MVDDRVATQSRKLARVIQRTVYPVYRRTLRHILPTRLNAILTELVVMTLRLGYVPRIRKPRTFNEKIAHRKLFEYDARYAQLADKWRVRDYVRQAVGSKYLTEVYAYFTDRTNFDARTLPERCVIKANHGAGFTLIRRSASDPNPEAISEIVRQWFSMPYGVETNEYWYQEICPRVVFAEELLEDARYGIPLDYKFFVFHGRVRVIEVDHGRFSLHRQRFYDPQWRTLPFLREHPMAPPIEAPKHLGEMIEVAEALAEGFDFVRVDLYEPNGQRVVFGELTFAPAAGWGRFRPASWDLVLGSYW